jgi:hypothetical protein
MSANLVLLNPSKTEFLLAFRLLLVLNSAARAVTNTPKFNHITPTWTASVVFDPGFVCVILYFHLKFTLSSFAAFYFIAEPNTQCC